jgi:16S rRNA G1207 methylase RsmC
MTMRLKSVVPAVVIVAVVVGLGTRSALAIKPFKDAFVAKYVKSDSKDPAAVAFAAACNKAKCTICHVGKNKKIRNSYGQQLAKLLHKETDQDNKEKINQALEQVAAIKVNPSSADSPTFGDLIQKGKLPGVKAK